MLTRFEVSGFKNLNDVVVEFGPFTCVAGPNAVGKSNLFDAIRFLSGLADSTFTEVCAGVRSVEKGYSSNLGSLFPETVMLGDESFRLAAEMIVPGKVVDDFGQEVSPARSYLRYELEFKIERDSNGVSGNARLRLENEKLQHVRIKERPFYFKAHPYLKKYLTGSTKSKDYMTLHPKEDRPYVSVPFEKSGRPRQIPIADAPRTILSSLASAEYPTLLAAKTEMVSWRFMALEPTAMRAPDERMETRPIDAAGAHVPASLYRQSVADENQEVYRLLSNDVGELVDVKQLRVVEDNVRQTLELRAQVGGAPELPARSLSDGTLRFLTLAAMAYSPGYIGLLGMEEPENGIHPAKIRAMLDLLLRLSRPRNGCLSQVLINTHSPYLVQGVLEEGADKVLCAVAWRRQNKGGGELVSTSFHPLQDTWRSERSGDSEEILRSQAPVSKSKLFAFLKSPSSWAECES